MGKADKKRLSHQNSPVGDSNSQMNKVFKFNTDLGQHILKNPLIAQAIVDKANIRPSDTVLEIGPGTGNLTVRILEQARNVVACEVDPKMAAELTKRVQGTPQQKKLEIVMGDFMKHETLPYHDICISNTPYQISSGIVFKLLSLPRPPRVSVLMFQREFAMILTARPGDALYNRLSANVQMWANVKHIMKVGKNNFRPPPKVESSVVRIEVKHPRPNIDFNEWDGLLRFCFNRKNKTLSAVFKNSKVLEILETNYKTFLAVLSAERGGMEVDDKADLSALVKEKVEKVLQETGFGEKRSSKLDQTDFLKLLFAFHQVGIHFA
ncbi:unnamed protein product [Kuraishia capsulata CBS 1993]|uniref:rRNA adenine N(6)-methyltransferase n=1 Tax=Kuraishia capsulata CBS 1993 TaxID=1382522 RepID=W6MSP1_9ASCO|nr:uncharacterized protein KUCA_T00005717001 [Kuraishia capsulata CBS 1993]CDK29724.1 unnamed protein product [Kuraishia capsulata CBS 1993]